MTITNGYCTLAELKGTIAIAGDDVIDDATLERVITTASRVIDNLCGQRFYLDGANVSRHFTAHAADTLFLGKPGLGTIATLKTDEDGDRTYETTWAATDYDLLPYNAAADSQPYLWIETAPNGRYSFPSVRRGVEISAKWGWPGVPGPIANATLLLAQKYFQRPNAPYGMAGTADMGTIRVIATNDPDILDMITPYKAVR